MGRRRTSHVGGRGVAVARPALRAIPPALESELAALEVESNAWTRHYAAIIAPLSELPCPAGLIDLRRRMLRLTDDVRTARHAYERGQLTIAAIVGAISNARAFLTKPIPSIDGASRPTHERPHGGLQMTTRAAPHRLIDHAEAERTLQSAAEDAQLSVRVRAAVVLALRARERYFRHADTVLIPRRVSGELSAVESRARELEQMAVWLVRARLDGLNSDDVVVAALMSLTNYCTAVSISAPPRGCG